MTIIKPTSITPSFDKLMTIRNGNKCAGKPFDLHSFLCPLCSHSCLVMVNPSGTPVVLHVPFSLHVSLQSLICQEMVNDVRLFIPKG